MSTEALLAVALFLVGALPLAAALARRFGVVASGLVLLVLGFGLWVALENVVARRPSVDEALVLNRPVQEPDDGYVSSDTCRACHADQYESWHASYHRTMTQVAKPGTVLGFDKMDFPGLDKYMYAFDGRFWTDETGSGVPTAEAGWQGKPKEIVLTTGSHHYQGFWFEDDRPDRRIALAPYVYLIQEQRWVPRRAAFMMPPNRAGSSEMGRWSAVCIKCHATHGQPRGVVSADRRRVTSIDSRVSEFGIACEACHGPAQEHVRKHKNPFTRYLQHLSSDDEGDPSIVNPGRLDHVRGSEVCGQCHSVYTVKDTEGLLDFVENGMKYRPGQELDEHRLLIRGYEDQDHPEIKSALASDPAFLDARFWPDGAIRTAGRDFSAQLRSPCFKNGDVSCMSCHTMHKKGSDPRSLQTWANDQLGHGMSSDKACVQCHAELGEEAEAHTRHAAGSSGSQCYNCHMPQTVFGLLKAIRSHEVDSPRVQTELETGRPNACNLCHLEKSLDWTARKLEEWYGQPVPELSADQKQVAAGPYWLLTGDAMQRALAASSFGWAPAQEASGTDWMVPYLSQLLVDPYAAVRFVVARSLRSLPGHEALDYEYLGPPPKWQATRAQTQEIFDRTRAGMPERPELLLQAGGTLHEEFERLLAERDDRPIELAE